MSCCLFLDARLSANSSHLGGRSLDLTLAPPYARHSHVGPKWGRAGPRVWTILPAPAEASGLMSQGRGATSERLAPTGQIGPGLPGATPAANSGVNPRASSARVPVRSGRHLGCQGCHGPRTQVQLQVWGQCTGPLSWAPGDGRWGGSSKNSLRNGCSGRTSLGASGANFRRDNEIEGPELVHRPSLGRTCRSEIPDDPRFRLWAAPGRPP